MKTTKESSPKHLWAKATLTIEGSLSESSQPFWIGVDKQTQEVLGSLRWDIPAGYKPLGALLKPLQEEALAEDIARARNMNLHDDHYCYAKPMLSLTQNALTNQADGQFGSVLDADLVATLDGIDPNDMRWIVTPEREKLSDCFHRLTSDQVFAIAEAVLKAGLSITILPAANQFRFGGIRLAEAPML